jgi:two-component sensor histidine kinase
MLELNALLVIVTELITNSVRHGPGNPIRLHVQLQDDGTLAGVVRDEGTGQVAIRHGEPVKGGMGLKVVDALTDRWGVEPGTSNVWFELSA